MVKKEIEKHKQSLEIQHYKFYSRCWVDRNRNTILFEWGKKDRGAIRICTLEIIFKT